MTIDQPSFILTAELDGANFRWLNALRQRHFPAACNHLDAHLTVFHKLDQAAVDVVRQTLGSPDRAPIALSFVGLRKLGRGVAIEVVAPELATLRVACAQALAGRLTSQDSQRFRPHVTIQNKAHPEIANALYAELKAGFAVRHGETHALQVWRYLGGPWRFVARLALTSGEPSPSQASNANAPPTNGELEHVVVEDCAPPDQTDDGRFDSRRRASTGQRDIFATR